MMKFREERNLLGLGLSTGFHDRYFILNHTCLRLYKEVRVSPACWLPARQRSLPLPALPFPCLHFPSQLCHVVTLCREALRMWDPCGLASHGHCRQRRGWHRMGIAGRHGAGVARALQAAMGLALHRHCRQQWG